MAKAISIINNKGGTGKTTTTLNLGAALQKIGKKVLLIDLDSQCNLSNAFNIQNPTEHIGNVMLSKSELSDAIINVNNIDIVPSVTNLLEFEYMINNEPGREYLLKEVLDKNNHYDYVIMDCPPSLGTLAINSLVAADSYIVPMQAENFAFQGLDRILESAEKVQRRMNRNLELAGILMVKFQPRTKFGQAVVKNIAQNHNLDGKLFNGYIRQDISLMEAPAFGQNIFEYAPSSRGATDYLNIAKELILKYGKA